MISRGTFLVSIASMLYAMPRSLQAEPIEFDNRIGTFPWDFIGMITADTEVEEGPFLLDFLDVTLPPSQSGEQELPHTMSYGQGVTIWSLTEPISESIQYVSPVANMIFAQGETITLPNPIFGTVDSFTAPRRLEYGEEVGAEDTYTFSAPVIRAVQFFDESSRWEFAESFGVLGLQFTLGGASHYGWLELRPERHLDGTIIRYLPARWGYESTPNTPITIPAGRGDCDADGDVDLSDFGRFQLCFGDGDSGRLPPDCRCVDYDGDNEVDLNDFAEFQLTFSGAI
jgi:hypothetical protein